MGISMLSFSAMKLCLPVQIYSNNFHRVYCSNAIAPIKMAFTLYDSSQTNFNNSNKKPLIIMHGLFGSKQNWRSISKALESKLKCKIYSVDARNHGDSPHDSKHSSAYMAEDIKELMRSEGLSKVMLMGHSMGGRAVMFFSLKYPELVERSVIVDISPISVPRDFLDMEQIFLAMKNIFVPPDASMADGRAIVVEQIKNAVHDRETVDFIMLNLRKLKNGSFAWALNVAALHENFRHFQNFMREIDGMSPFQGPVLFVCGNKSNFVDHTHWPAIKQIFPMSEIAWLDAGHLVHYDQPAQFINLVSKFLIN